MRLDRMLPSAFVGKKALRDISHLRAEGGPLHSVNSSNSKAISLPEQPPGDQEVPHVRSRDFQATPVAFQFLLVIALAP